MQGAEHQVPGFRRRQRQTNGFQIPHLTHQDDIRIFPQRGTQCFSKAQGVSVHLALVQQALFRFVHEFDGILNGEDVLVTGFIDVIEHGRQGGGLTGTGGAGHQHNTAGKFADILEHLALPQILHGQNLGGDGSEYRAGPPVLIERVHPEPGHTRHFKGEVCFQKFFKVLTLLVVHDVINQAVHLLMIHSGQIDSTYIAVHPDHGGQTGRQVQVRRSVFNAKGKQFGNVHGIPSLNWVEVIPESKILFC